MREVLSFHLGQAGVQLGNAVWELMCMEHSITEYGCRFERNDVVENVDSFFATSIEGRLVPRCMLIDLEPTVIDEIRRGSYRSLFHPSYLISGPEDAANNFARGFFTVGKLVLGTMENQIRRMVESCDAVQTMLLFRSLGGGTGSGLTSAMFDNLAEYPKVLKTEMPIYPSAEFGSSTVESYNTLLGEHFCMDDIGLSVMFENEALFNIASYGSYSGTATFQNVNRLIAQVISNITSSFRFESVTSNDVNALQANLVPYPRIHYPLSSFAPVLTYMSAERDNITVSDITKSLFHAQNQMMVSLSDESWYMSCALTYRGDVSLGEVHTALQKIKSEEQIRFVDWCPTGFKIGINVSNPTTVPSSNLVNIDKSAIMLTNNSSIGYSWNCMALKFQKLYCKHCFVHWFIAEGLEECEFRESLNNFESLVFDYREIVLPQAELEARQDDNNKAASNDNNDDVLSRSGNNQIQVKEGSQINATYCVAKINEKGKESIHPKSKMEKFVVSNTDEEIDVVSAVSNLSIQGSSDPLSEIPEVNSQEIPHLVLHRKCETFKNRPINFDSCSKNDNH